jgi:transposase
MAVRNPPEPTIMFPRVTTVKHGAKTYEYLKIVESYRENGQVKQRVVGNLGRLDQLGTGLDDLVASLSKYCQSRFARSDQIQCQETLGWGPVLLARHLWEQMNLPEIVGEFCGRSKRKFDVAETAFVLVANRLCEPGSEHGLARWLEHTFVCDHKGRRWKPEWLPVKQITKQQRVKVRSEQLNRWYRTLDALVAAKDKIEHALYLKVRDLFSVKVDLVFYDLTSTYFCRKSPKGKLRRHGKSKEGKPRQVQVVLGVVMANGWPIAHHVFPGNTADKKTLCEVLRDLEKRFGLRRVMVVGDRGMVSPENLEFLSETKFRHLLGIPGRRSEEAAAVLAAFDEDGWVRVDKGNRVQEVRPPGYSARYFIIDSQERKAYEEAMRQRSMERARQALDKVAAAVTSGRLKDQAKIGARAARAVAGNHGHRYYSWDVSGRGQFRFFEDPDKLRAEMRHEGKYILKTDDADITAVEAVAAYKELATVESGFRDLKDVIDMRPVYHKRDDRVCAHIFVATLALFLKRTLAYQLATQLPELSSTDAIAAMRSIGMAELNLGGETIRLVPRGGRDARRVLSVLGITDVDPPGPKKP